MDEISVLREAVVALHEQAHDKSPARTCQREPCVALNRVGVLDTHDSASPGRIMRSIGAAR